MTQPLCGWEILSKLVRRVAAADNPGLEDGTALRYYREIQGF